MIVHGDKDSLVPHSDSVKAIEFISPPKELITIMGAEHGFERQRYFQNADKKLTPQFLNPAIEATAEWFKRCLTL